MGSILKCFRPFKINTFFLSLSLSLVFFCYFFLLSFPCYGPDAISLKYSNLRWLDWQTHSHAQIEFCVYAIGGHVQCSFSFIYYYYYYVSVEWVRDVAYAVTFKRICNFRCTWYEMNYPRIQFIDEEKKLCVRLRCMWNREPVGIETNCVHVRSINFYVISVDLVGIKSRMADHTISTRR